MKNAIIDYLNFYLPSPMLLLNLGCEQQEEGSNDID